jgi:hypothetical protein
MSSPSCASACSPAARTGLHFYVDLEEAGADWLSEQGFDRKDRFSGDH